MPQEKTSVAKENTLSCCAASRPVTEGEKETEEKSGVLRPGKTNQKDMIYLPGGEFLMGTNSKVSSRWRGTDAESEGRFFLYRSLYSYERSIFKVCRNDEISNRGGNVRMIVWILQLFITGNWELLGGGSLCSIA